MESEQFGDYTLVRCLAIGGMGELYLAQRAGVAGFSKQLVVKRIRPELAGDAEFVEMFLNEGRLAAMLDHPNVVHIYELGQAEGAYFMAMEYVAGKNLNTVLNHNGGPLELSMALGVINGVCEGMAFAHDALGPDGYPLNLVHRDINPQNVLISYSGTVKIADFGIAKAHLQQRKETQVGVLKGKFGYLSPEQARSGAVDRRSDIYTMGLLLFEATVGLPAIPGKSDTQLLYAAAEGIVQRPTDLTPDYPQALEQIYLRATARDPAERYQTVKDLQEDLLAFQLDQRMVVTSSKLADLMRQLFSAEGSGERRLPTPAHAASAGGTPGRSDQEQRPSSGPIRTSGSGLDFDDEGLREAPTVMEGREVSQPVVEGSYPGVSSPPRDISTEQTQMMPSPDTPALSPEIASAETQMLGRSTPQLDVEPALSSAETRMLGDSTPEVVVGAPSGEDPEDLRQTDPRPRTGAIAFQPPIAVEEEEQTRSRWPVILISTLLTLILAGGALYFFVLRPGLGSGPGLPSGSQVTDGSPPARQDAGSAAVGRTLADSGASTDKGQAATASLDGGATAPDKSVPLSAKEAGAATSADAGSSAITAGSPRVDGTTRRPGTHKTRVEIACKPTVTVIWRGRRMGQTPLTVALPPGKQRITLSSRNLGIRVARRITVPRRGATTRVNLEVGQGTLAVKARPWAHVIINGTRRGTTPFNPLKLYEGTYRVKLTNNKFGAHQAKVRILPGQTSRLVHVFK